MAKIVIAEVDIDSAALIKSATENKNKIDELRKSLKDLKDENGNLTQAGTIQQAQIQKLSAEYNNQKNVIATLVDSSGKLEKTTKAITDLTAKEITSITSARKNNSDLLKIRNELNLATVEGAAAAKEINDKLDDNNKFIKANVSEYEKQKIGIGDYKTAITGALSESGLLAKANSDLGESFGFISTTVKACGPAFTSLNQTYQTTLDSIKNIIPAQTAAAETSSDSADATKELSTAQKAYAIATGIATAATNVFTLALAATGILLVVAAVALIINYFRQLDPVVDKVEQAFAGVKGVIDFLTETIGSFIENIKSVGDVVGKLGDFFSHPIDSLKSFGKEMGEAAKKAADLKERQQDLADQQDINSLANKKEESEIARLLIQAKDRSKSAEEQNALFAKAEQLNREIFERNKKTAAEELDIAVTGAANAKKLNAEEIQGLREKGIAYANFLLNKGRIRQADYEDLKKAYEAEIDIENQKNEQLDKITTKKNNAIEKSEADAEAAAKKREDERQKILDEAAKRVKLELDLFIQSQGIRAKSLEEELAIAQQVADKKNKIAEAEFNATKKTEADKLALRKAQNDAQLELLRAQQSAIVDIAQRELDIYTANDKSLIDGKKFLSDELYNLELERLNRTAEAEAKYQTDRLAAGVINEQQYQDAIAEIDRKQTEANDALKEERDTAEKEKQALDLQAKIDTDQLNFENEFAAKQIQLDQAQAAELEAAKKNGANVELINKKYAAGRKAIEKEIADFTIAQELSIVQGIKGLFAENTLAFKAAAAAEVIITTINNATKAFTQAAVFASNPLTAPLAINANIQGGIIVATGALQLAKIAGVKFEKGGIAKIEGKSHAAGGEPVYIGGQYVGEAQGDEGVGILNRGAFAAFMDFNNKFSDGDRSTPTLMAGGGIITQGVQKPGIDVAALAEITIEAVRNMPAPIVGVRDIIDTTAGVVSVEEGANF